MFINIDTKTKRRQSSIRKKKAQREVLQGGIRGTRVIKVILDLLVLMVKITIPSLIA